MIIIPFFIIIFLLTPYFSYSETNKEIFGVCDTTFWPGAGVVFTEEIAKDMETAGIRWIRTEVIADLNGEVNIKAYKEIVDRAKRHNIKLLFLIDYSTVRAEKQEDWATFEYRQKFISILKKLVNEFKKEVRHWEIWNEEDFAHFKVPSSAYSELLTESYECIKSIDRSLTVVFGGLSNCWGDGGAKTYLEEVYQSPKFKDYYIKYKKYPFDVLGIHPYNWKYAPETYLADAILKNIKSVMNKYGDHKKPIYLTEIGWCVDPSDPTAMGDNVNENEKNQADYLEELYKICSGLKDPSYPSNPPFIQKVFFFCYKGGGFGLTRDYLGKDKRPSYERYKKIATGN